MKPIEIQNYSSVIVRQYENYLSNPGFGMENENLNSTVSFNFKFSYLKFVDSLCLWLVISNKQYTSFLAQT